MSSDRKDLPSKTPRLKLTFKHSLQSNDVHRSATRLLHLQDTDAVDNGTGTLRSAFSQTTRLAREGIMRSSRRGKTKVVRSICQRPVASKSACSCFVGDPKVAALLRPSLPFKLQVLVQVGKRQLKGKSSKKSSEKFMTVANGVVMLKPRKPENAGRSENDLFLISNIVGFSFRKEEKYLNIQVRSDGRSAKDEIGHYTLQHLSIYTLKFSSPAQAEEIARSFLKEIDNYASMIDIGLGWMEEKGMKDDMQNHFECLLRKRVDLFSISKPAGSDVLTFAIGVLVNHLQDTDEEDEAKFWKGIMDKNSSSREEPSSRHNSGLKYLQEAYQQTLKAEKFKDHADRLRDVFTFNANENKEILTSFYCSLYKQGRIDEAD